MSNAFCASYNDWKLTSRSVTFFPINGPCKPFGESTPADPTGPLKPAFISPSVNKPLTGLVGYIK